MFIHARALTKERVVCCAVLCAVLFRAHAYAHALLMYSLLHEYIESEDGQYSLQNLCWTVFFVDDEINTCVYIYIYIHVCTRNNLLTWKYSCTLNGWRLIFIVYKPHMCALFYVSYNITIFYENLQILNKNYFIDIDYKPIY